MMRSIWAVLTSSSAARMTLGFALLAGVLFALVRWMDRAQDAAVTQATERGRAEQRSDDRAATLDQVEKAKNAQETIWRDDGAARAGCVRYSRTPETASDSYCLIAKPLSFANAPKGLADDPGNRFDTGETVAEIMAHNAAYDGACNTPP